MLVKTTAHEEAQVFVCPDCGQPHLTVAELAAYFANDGTIAIEMHCANCPTNVMLRIWNDSNNQTFMDLSREAIPRKPRRR